MPRQCIAFCEYRRPNATGRNVQPSTWGVNRRCKQECEEHDGAVILLATLWGEGKQENGDVCWFVVMMIEVCLERCFYASVLSEL